MRSLLIIVILLIHWPAKSQMHDSFLQNYPESHYLKKIDSLNYTDGFDFPVGKPDGDHYYNAQPFGKNNHLGDDWNGIGGGNTDLGDAIYTIANGYVSLATDIGGGWGNVIRIKHFLKNGQSYESLYAHCDTILVKKGDYISKGTKIGTIGTANNRYLAHLHFEIRNIVDLPIGQGYSNNTKGYINPTAFIQANRE